MQKGGGGGALDKGEGAGYMKGGAGKLNPLEIVLHLDLVHFIETGYMG